MARMFENVFTVAACRTNDEQVTKVIWQKTASPRRVTYPLRRRMHSCAADGDEQCSVHSIAGTTELAGIRAGSSAASHGRSGPNIMFIHFYSPNW